MNTPLGDFFVPSLAASYAGNDKTSSFVHEVFDLGRFSATTQVPLRASGGGVVGQLPKHS